MDQLKLNPAFEGLEVTTFRLKLKKVTTVYNNQPLLIKQVQTLFVYHQQPNGLRQALDLLLAVEFEPEAHELLKAEFLILQQSPPHQSGSGYEFRFKPDALNRYGGDFGYAITLEDWLRVGPGALLDFANYECTGLFDFNE